MKSCRICGKTDKETQIIDSQKYGMCLCRYHYKEMCNKHLDADNLIKDNYIIINNIKFYLLDNWCILMILIIINKDVIL